MQMYLPRLISVFTQLFSWETLEVIQSQLDFRFQLKLLLSRIKINNNNNNNNSNHNHHKSITQMVQVEFLTFQNQVMNKRANALPKKKCKKKNTKKLKYKRLLKLSGCVSRRF